MVASDIETPQPQAGASHQHPVQWVSADVTDAESLSALAAQAGQRLDAVVYSAGLLGVGALSQMPIARLEQVLQVNAIGAVRLVQACLPALIEARGRVVMVSSEVADQKGAPFNGPYSMSKKALDAAAESCATSWECSESRWSRCVPARSAPHEANCTTRLMVQAITTAPNRNDSSECRRAARSGVANWPERSP